MRIVADTNVWVSGLLFPRGKPGQVLETIRTGRVAAVASWALAGEIADTLRDPRFAKYELTEEDISCALSLLVPLVPDVDVDVDLRDPDDACVVASALAGRVPTIVTGDRDLLDDAGLRQWLARRGTEVLTPAEFLARLERGAK